MSESKPSTPGIDVRFAAYAPRVFTALLAFAGIVNPLICFGCAAPSGNWLADQPWQSGEFWVYATLLLKWPAVWPFYPVLLFSMASLGLVLWDRERYSPFILIKLGVYGGIILSLMFGWLIYAPTNRVVEAIGRSLFALLTIGAATIFGLMLVAIVVIIGDALLRPVAKRLGGWAGLAVLFTSLIGLLTSALAIVEPIMALNIGVRLLGPPLLIMLAAGPAWALLAYGVAAFVLIDRPKAAAWRWKVRDALALTTWTACLFGAWRRAMDLAIQEYATLPMEAPNCFVCSAAARGHRRLVRSEAVCVDGQRVVWTNAQLRVLKAAELAMMTGAPRAHRAVRRIYNFIGPRLARRLKNPWAADAAYLALKPVEWLARAALWMLGVGH